MRTSATFTGPLAHKRARSLFFSFWPTFGLNLSKSGILKTVRPKVVCGQFFQTLVLLCLSIVQYLLKAEFSKLSGQRLLRTVVPNSSFYMFEYCTLFVNSKIWKTFVTHLGDHLRHWHCRRQMSSEISKQG